MDKITLAPGQTAIAFAVEKVGGQSAAARVCELTPTAISKWLKQGHLPRTEFTGETDHAQRLATASAGAFSADWLRANAKPQVEKAVA